jgi:hypothetical protein
MMTYPPVARTIFDTANRLGNGTDTSPSAIDEQTCALRHPSQVSRSHSALTELAADLREAGRLISRV